MSKIIVFAFPVFLLLIAIELWWDRRQVRLAAASAQQAKSSYGLSDTLSSLSLGLMSQVTGVLAKFIGLAAYAAVFGYVALWPQADLWNHWYGWCLALVLYDFCYYWLHRAGHEVAVFWAAHVVHHQSQHYNLSTALRQTSSGALLGWVFYLPMAVLGVPPLLFGIVALVDLLYQFWVHTEHVKRLGWFDRVFCSPSNHRVHHAINDGYVDRNYGGIWVVWDRLFGTFEPEVQTCVYGTRTPLNSWDPVWANVAVYSELWRRSLAAPQWTDKLRVWLKPPGWLPEGGGGQCRIAAGGAPAHAGAAPSTAFELHQVRTYAPVLTIGQALFAAAQNALLTGLGAWYLWHVDAQALPLAALGAAALTLGLWMLGRYLQQLRAASALLIQGVAVATVLTLNPLPF
jgi:sterol desaturase/sphingolipid hydroxylase (fatty acid hydroxylase superfamily)